jgi:ABC-type transport system involved in multi-copper enzyme maturation permease subunit
MSTVVQWEEPAAEAAPEAKHPGAWRVTWHGVWTVARLELRQRVRSTRWIVALVVWFVVVGAITLLATGALSSSGVGVTEQRGVYLFAIVSFLVLGLGLVVTPTLTSTTINGDRNAGTLATLQVTLLSPAEIVVGKLLAAWLAAIAFLVASLPFFVLAVSLGGTPVRSAFAVLALIAVLLAAVCGMGVGFSALTARTAGSTVLTFAAVTGLVAITPILFAVTFPSIQGEQEVRVWGPTRANGYVASAQDCAWTSPTRSVSHTERTWWLLAINPFVVVADGSAVPDDDNADLSPFAALRGSVREARWGADRPLNECWAWSGDGRQVAPPEGFPDPSRAPIWPWGLAFDVLLGAAGAVVAVRRLSIPQRVLPRGVRVA